MKTTIRLDETLHTAAKKLAARTGRSLSGVIEDALRQMLARRSQAAERPPVHLPTVAGNGVQPGVDLDDSAALLELKDGFDSTKA